MTKLPSAMNETGNRHAERLKQKARRISIREGGAFGIFDGFGLRYIIPYALLLQVSNAMIGILVTVPQLIGNFAQLLTLQLLARGYQRKTIASRSVLLQTSMWLPIVLLGVGYFGYGIQTGWIPWALVLFYSLMMIFGTSLGPAWSSWMGDIIPKEIGSYFGRRNRVVNLASISSMLLAGLILQSLARQARPFAGFVIIFSVAFLGRLVSGLLLRRQYEPQFVAQNEYFFTLGQFIRKIPQSNFGKFVTYVALMQLTTYISAPFFPVYMLRDLGFDYLHFTLVTMTLPFVSMLLMPAWGRFSDTYGNLKTVRICGLIIPFIPLLWSATAFFAGHRTLVLFYLFAVETLSGFAWAGFTLASTNFIYEAVTRQRMAICVAYFNIFSGTGIFIGGLAGGQLASLPNHFNLFSNLILVLLISAGLRLLVSVILLPLIREVRDVPDFGMQEARQRLAVLSAVELLRYLSLRSLNPRR